MFDSNIGCYKNWIWISMSWISISNNIKIDMYEHQINIHFCLWITLVSSPFDPKHTSCSYSWCVPPVVSPSPSLQPCHLCSLQSEASTGCPHGRSYRLWACWAGPTIPPSWQCGVLIQVLAFPADEQSAQGWSKGAWLCAGSSCPTDVSPATCNAHLYVGEF